MVTRRIAIIGAGPAGSAAAHTLRRHGHEVVIYERAPALGGRTRTYREGRFRLDTGAGFITNFYPRVTALGEETGFGADLRRLERVTGLHHNGRMAQLDIGSLRSFFAYPFIGMRDKLRMIRWTGTMTLKRRQMDLVDPGSLAPFDDCSVEQLARESVGDKAYEFLVRPGIEPFWYFSCEDVSASMVRALTAHAAGARFYYYADGIDRICSGLIGDCELVLEASVARVDVRGKGVELVIERPGFSEAKRFDKVVVATTGSVAHQVTADLPETVVSSTQRAFLMSQRYAANVHLCYRIPKLDPRPKVSSIFPVGPGPHPLAAVAFQRIRDAEADAHDDELVSVYLSDVESRRVMDWTDEALYRHGLELARTVYPGLPTHYEPFHLTRRAEAIPVHGVGRYRQAVAFEKAQAQCDGRVVFCGDYLTTATVEGAVASGLNAADAILRQTA